MKIAISQPTFLPWSGYFSLISNVDEFIFLDNVQFNKRSWQQRNYIISQNKLELISIPVKSKGRYDQTLDNVEIDYKNLNIKKILNKISFSYKKEENFEIIFPKLKKIFELEHKYLADLNIDIITYVCNFLSIKTKLIRSSSFMFDFKLTKIDLLSFIAQERNAREYISTEGAKVYLKKLKNFPNTDIAVKYFRFNSQESEKTEMDKFPCILDLLFKKGTYSKITLNENFILFDQ